MKYGQKYIGIQTKSVNQIKRCLIITCNRYYTTSSKGDIIICSTAAPRTIYDDMRTTASTVSQESTAWHTTGYTYYKCKLLIRERDRLIMFTVA